MRVVLLGAPGAGKGTQGAGIADRLGVPYISTGERLRAEAARGTDLGRRVASLLDQGELVPDGLVLAALGDWLGSEQAAEGWVLDGFPRTVGQAELARGLVEPDVVVYLDIPDDEARSRLAGRAQAGRHDDADPDVIERRLRLFHRETEPLLDYYRARNLLRPIDATKPPAGVAEELVTALGAAGPAHS